MAAIVTTDGLQAATWAGMDKIVRFYRNNPASSSNLFNGSFAASLWRRLAWLPSVPNPLETGVTKYIVSKFQCTSSTASAYLLCEEVLLGSLDISGASGTFTDGNAAPTRKVLGTNMAVPLMPMVETDTALNSAPGAITFNYLNQDGNARTAGSTALTASSVQYSAGIPILGSGDTGVTDITAASRTAGTTPTGTVKLYGLLPIYAGLMSPVQVPINVNLINEGIVHRLEAGARLALYGNTNSAIAVNGAISYIGDA